MFRRTFIAAAIAAAVVIPSRTQATENAPTHSAFCMFGSFRVGQVASLYTPTFAGKGAARRFAGAQVFIAAQPGLTAEWIQANLTRHIAEAKAHRSYDCPLDVEGVSVSVVSGGTGFWVQMSSRDAGAAHEILNRSRRLLR